MTYEYLAVALLILGPMLLGAALLAVGYALGSRAKEAEYLRQLARPRGPGDAAEALRKRGTIHPRSEMDSRPVYLPTEDRPTEVLIDDQPVAP